MRIILFTGKGGVGKTTISLATAISCAKFGYKTLVISTDIAHNLSDALGIEIGDKVKKVSDKLYCQEIDVQSEVEKNWALIKGHAAAFLKSKGMQGLVAEELAIIPGLEEVFSLLELKEHFDSGKFDVIILDTAPTASSLRLLSFPEAMAFWVKNIFGILGQDKLKPLSKLTSFFPKNSEVRGISKTFSTIRMLYTRIKRLKKILQNPDITTVRIVINLEKMVIAEAQKLLTYLNLFGISVDCVIANKIIPEDLSDRYFKERIEMQKKYLMNSKEVFSPIPLFSVKLYPKELIGEKVFSEFTKYIYGEDNPTKIFYYGTPFKFEKEDNYFIAIVELPYVKKEKINLIRKNDDLFINIGEYKQSIALPHSYHKLKVKEAKYESGRLKIYFVK